MRGTIGLLLVLAWLGPVQAGLVDTMWVRTWAGPDSVSFKLNRAADVYADTWGNVYVCGSGESAAANNTDMLVAKYNKWGDLRWLRTYGGNITSEEDMAQALVVDSAGNVFVAGLTENSTPSDMDITYCKYDSAGNLLWARKSNFVDDDAAFDIALGRSQDLYICGAVVDTHFGLSAFLVMRVNPLNGDTVWTRRYILDTAAFVTKRPGRDRHPDFVLWDDWSAWDNCASALAVHPDSGVIVVTGFGYSDTRGWNTWTMKFQTNGTRLWEHDWHLPGNYDYDDAAFDVAVARTGQIYLAGICEHEDRGYDYVVVRYAPSGGAPMNYAWTNIGTVDGDDYAASLCLDDSTPIQNVYVTGFVYYGYTTGRYQVLTQKYSGGLAARWGSGAFFGGSGDDYGFDICYNRGRVYVAGMRNNDLLVLGYTAQNTSTKDTLWSYSYNAPANQQDMGAAVWAVDSDRVYVAGQCTRTTTPFATDLFTSRLGYPDPDLRARVVLVPGDTVNYLDTVTPQVRIVNEGNTRARFWAKLFIGSGYQDSVNWGSWLYPGDSVAVSFADWIAQPLGRLAIRCTVALNGDRDPSNNRVIDSVFVALRDVGCRRIMAPTGTVDSGAVVSPQAVLFNAGNQQETFNAKFMIGPDYADSVTVTLNSGDSTLWTFRNWSATRRGTWPVRCSTRLGADRNPGNDRAADTVRIRVTDVATRAIVAPAGVVDSGITVTPEARVANLGTEPADLRAYFVLDDGADAVVYYESLLVTLGPGRESTLSFPASPPLTRVGTWHALARAKTANDQQPANDSVRADFLVRSGGMSWPPGWVEVEPLPLPASNRAVKGGGSLVPFTAVSPMIYAVKGNKSADFYVYAIMADTWRSLPPIPLGVENKLVDKGGRLCTDGVRYIYLTKGANTFEFWRFDLVADSWEPLADVPAGTSGKKVKGGTDMVYVVLNDTGYVYLLKGYKCDFLRYNTVSKTWQTLPDAPAGVRPKWDKGSWIVIDDNATWLYAHKAKVHEFYRYDLAGGAWDPIPLTGMPFVGMMGKSKKSKDGGGAAWFQGQIWALKGGNTQEFWCYDVATGSWTEKDTMPAYGSTGKKKRVKDGGDIVYSAYAFWAFKGNKTLEFWRYGIPLEKPAPSRPERTGVMAADRTPVNNWSWSIVPNPAGSGFAALRYTVAYPVGLSARLYDATGRQVRVVANRIVNGSGTLPLNTAGLVPGVYLLRLDAGNRGPSQSLKLVVR